jgi:hypothetical protein
MSSMDDDAIRAFGLDHDLVSRAEASGFERLYGERHLVLRRDFGHAFTLL